MCPLYVFIFFTLPLPLYLKKWFGGRVAINKKKINFQLTISLTMSILIFSSITFSFFAAVIILSCGSRRTDLLPSGLMLLYELEMPSTLRAGKQNLSLVSTTRYSFKRRRPCTYKWRSLFWIHRVQRHPNKDTVIQNFPA